MSPIRWGIAALVSPLLLTGCGVMQGVWSGEQQRLSGLLERSNGGFVLRECGSQRVIPLVESENVSAIYLQASQPGQTAIFTDLTGQLDRHGRLHPDQVLRMQSHGRGCSDDSARTAQWVAQGYQPVWQAWLSPGGLVRFDGELTYPARSVVIEQLPDGALNAASLPDHQVELWLYPQPCQDPTTGDYFHLRATLLVNGEQLRGCGYQGALATP
ncbi:lipoprotein [Halopseudomonas oceani]|uniref:Lipoprotein n=1 Tax=Halopseudomonas oceani TaxID=1708783 RepID=A0A2P4EWR1_9GAMM|nr:hypothetical protein [Halopseudomonas oceani]POB04369.1 hypothetical protein C1949_08105 [Halopseudomonas oceani]GGE31855.1 lipoprotein [Halopseudomonas oceani]